VLLSIEEMIAILFHLDKLDKVKIGEQQRRVRGGAERTAYFPDETR
jgi:hypothetical protein